MKRRSLIASLCLLCLMGCEIPTPPPLEPAETINRLTLVYEVREWSPPPALLAALSEAELSHGSVAVSVFEEDSTTGTGAVPKQFARAKAAADQYGRPALVAESAERVVRVRLKPKDREDVRYALEGAKP